MYVRHKKYRSQPCLCQVKPGHTSGCLSENDLQRRGIGRTRVVADSFGSGVGGNCTDRGARADLGRRTSALRRRPLRHLVRIRLGSVFLSIFREHCGRLKKKDWAFQKQQNILQCEINHVSAQHERIKCVLDYAVPFLTLRNFGLSDIKKTGMPHKKISGLVHGDG